MALGAELPCGLASSKFISPCPPKLCKKKEVSWGQAFISPCFLAAEAMWPSASHSCHHAVPTMIDCTLNCEPNKPFCKWFLSGSCHSSKKGANTLHFARTVFIATPLQACFFQEHPSLSIYHTLKSHVHPSERGQLYSIFLSHIHYLLLTGTLVDRLW